MVDDAVPIFALATGRGLAVAADLGLPVVVGGPVLDDPSLPEILADYRRAFRPHRDSRSRVTVSLDVLVTDTDAEARDLALPEVWAMAQSRRTGSFGPLEPVSTIRAQLRDDRHGERHRDRIEQGLDRVTAGDAQTVRRRLEQLVERSAADELLVSGSTYDRDALAASDSALVRILG